MVNIDETESLPYEDIFTLVFSPDSRRLAYTVQSRGKVNVVVDEVQGEPYDAIMGQGLEYDSPTAIHYLALRGDEIYLVEESID
jgi:hypothetical protein